jgi:hypothetical protein
LLLVIINAQTSDSIMPEGKLSPPQIVMALTATMSQFGPMIMAYRNREAKSNQIEPNRLETQKFNSRNSHFWNSSLLRSMLPSLRRRMHPIDCRPRPLNPPIPSIQPPAAKQQLLLMLDALHRTTFREAINNNGHLNRGGLGKPISTPAQAPEHLFS